MSLYDEYLTLCIPCVVRRNSAVVQCNVKADEEVCASTEICDDCEEERSCRNYFVTFTKDADAPREDTGP